MRWSSERLCDWIDSHRGWLRFAVFEIVWAAAVWYFSGPRVGWWP